MPNSTNINITPDPWTEFTFKYIQPRDYSAVLDHLHNTYYQEEPVNTMLGEMSADRVADLHTRYTHILNTYPKSLCIVSTQNPTKIVGVLIIRITDVNNPLPDYQLRSPLTAAFHRFLEQAEESSSCNIHHLYGLSTFPETCILSVDPAFRGKGLATELVRRATQTLLFDDGYPLVYSEFSHPLSRKVGHRLGFKEIGRFYFKDFKSEEFPLVPPTHPDDDDENFVSMTVLEKM